MFKTLGLPKWRFLIAPNPLAHAESQRLTQSAFRWGMRLLLGLMIATAVGLMVLAFEPTSNPDTPLRIVGAGLGMAHLLIFGRTLLLGAGILSKEFQQNTWEPLILTHLSARQILMGKWWAIFRQVWLWHLLIGLNKTAMAFVFAQYLHEKSMQQGCTSSLPLELFCYNFDMRRYTDFYLHLVLEPDVVALAPLFILTGIIGVLQGMVALTLGMMGGAMVRGNHLWRWMVPLGLWGLLNLGLVGMVFAYEDYQQTMVEAPIVGDNWLDKRNQAANRREQLTAIDLGVFGITTTGDGGVIAGAYFLRPYQPTLYHQLYGLGMAGIGIFALLVMHKTTLFLTERLLVWRGASQPKPDHSLAQIAITSQQRAHLRRIAYLQGRKMRIVMTILLATTLGLTWLPFRQKTDFAHEDFLMLIIGIAYAAHIFIALRTLHIATNSIAREYHTADWEALILTGISARALVLGKWWSVLRNVWPYHLAAALMKMGVVFGLTKWLYTYPFYQYYSRHQRLIDLPDVGYPFYKYGVWSSLYQFDEILPNVEYVLTAAAALIFLAIAEAALLSAIGILSGFLIRKMGVGRLRLAVGLRLLLMLPAFYLVTYAPNRDKELAVERGKWYPTEPLLPIELSHATYTLQAVHLAAVAQIDGGVLAGVGLMPMWDMRTGYLLYRATSPLLSLIWSLGSVLAILKIAQWMAMCRGVSP